MPRARRYYPKMPLSDQLLPGAPRSRLQGGVYEHPTRRYASRAEGTRGQPRRLQDPLQYHSGRGIEWAYGVIEARERDQLHFAKMSDEQFAWALAKARAADYGHEGDYAVPDFENYLGTDQYGNTVTKRRDRWFNENREELLQRARENVRDWAYTWKQQQA